MPKKIHIAGGEFWDEDKEEFIYGKDVDVVLEHSLVSVSKWEARWHKAFLKKAPKTVEEQIDYVRCMTITQNVDPNVYYRITPKQFEEINDYIEDRACASYIGSPSQVGAEASGETVTSDLIYYWMITYNVPVEFQKWHLNKLLTLIKICDAKNAPKKQASMNELYQRNAAARRGR